MEKLELKHLAPYLPYRLKGEYILSDVIKLLSAQKDEIRHKILTEDSIQFFRLYCRPILRPLSDLTKEIEHNGEVIQAYREVNKILNDGKYSSGWNEIEFNEYGNLIIRFGDHCPVYSLNMEAIPVINFLLSCHFDIFNLIPQNLAIDINTIQK